MLLSRCLLLASAQDGHVGGPASLRHLRDQVLSSLSRGDRRGNSTNAWREDVRNRQFYLGKL